MAAVAAAERQDAISQIGKRSDRTPARRDDLGHPGEIGIAHRNRLAAMFAPHIGGPMGIKPEALYFLGAVSQRPTPPHVQSSVEVGWKIPNHRA
jgi:hypothetical protein